ncbi:MAG TPA: MaoC/PaaZ C-terminal domain-containing protein [Candidatus Binataceae bacterium]|jgi:acyl dehydratase|nr:MaoC/PaaZ C-terminal domain-containing protein [Candidatus Binataceae bacterium]
MALNRACLGKIYPPITTEVTRAALQNYARACNDLNPRYFRADPPGPIVAPPMFAVVVTWLSVITAMTDTELHADLLRLLHVAQDIEFLAPISAGDSITSTGRIASIETNQNGETMALELDAHNARGQAVTHITFTVFIRGRRADAQAAKAEETIRGVQGDRGAPLATVAQTVDLDQTARYAEASGDRNPIHVDANVAKMAGLPGIIVHGLCTMAFTASMMVDSLCDGDPARLRRLAVRFSRPVIPGDTITTRVWSAGDRGGRRVLSYETCNSDGVVVIRDGIAEITA